MNLKSIFFKEEIEEDKKGVDATVKKTTASQPQAIITSPVSIQTGTDYSKVLDDVLEQGTKDGEDFLHFHKAIIAMDGKPLTEEQKYEFTYPAYKSLGITAEKLINSASYNLSLLDKEEQKFTAEWNDAQSQQVEAKKKMIEKLAAENADLAQKIQDNNSKSQKLNEEVFASTNSLNNEKMGFENQLNIKKSVIQDRITKIKTYLYANTAK